VDDIRERARDARMLWDADRREGAFLLALVSVAVRAKLQFPEIGGDRAKFEEFMRSRLGPRVSVEFVADRSRSSASSTSGCAANSCTVQAFRSTSSSLARRPARAERPRGRGAELRAARVDGLVRAAPRLGREPGRVRNGHLL